MNVTETLLYTGYPQVIHKISTVYLQDIHKSTGYTQVINTCEKPVDKKLSTGLTMLCTD